MSYVALNELESAQVYFDRWPEYYKEMHTIVVEMEDMLEEFEKTGEIKDARRFFDSL